MASHPADRRSVVALVKDHRGAVAIAALFLLLALYYNVSVPLWEADSEWAHYQYARYIAMNRRLPRVDDRVSLPPVADQCTAITRPAAVEVHQFRQPPLYYLVGAIALLPLDLSDDWPVIDNPHVFNRLNQGGSNVAVHTAAEAFPYRGTALAVHLLRLVSTAMGLAGLLGAYLLGLWLFPRQRRLAQALMAFTAFNPQYVFSSATVNNDILAGALGAWCLYLAARGALRGPKPTATALAGLAMALAILAKYTAIALVPVVLTALAANLVQTWRSDRAHFVRRGLVGAGLMAAAALPVAGWLLRNQRLYGQLFIGYDYLMATFLSGPTQIVAAEASDAPLNPLRSLQFTAMTYWGLFGNDNIALPPAVLAVLYALFLAALVGLGLFLADRRQPRELRAAAGLALFFVAVAWALATLKALGTSEPRGRYLMPLYAAVSLLLVVGLHRLLPSRLRVAGLGAAVVFLALLTAAVPPFLLRPAYAAPPLAASADLLPGEQPLHATFGDVAELVGYRIEPSRLQVFEKAEVTLVWRALRSTPNNYTVSVHLLDGGQQPHGFVARFPGRGNFATSLWQPGDVFRETYEVYVEPSVRGRTPSLGQVQVAMYCYGDDANTLLPVADPNGVVVGDTAIFGRFKLATAPRDLPPSAAEEPALRFRLGDAIGVEAIQATPDQAVRNQEMAIELRFRALGRPAADYTVFAHLVDAAGQQVAGYDQPLTQGYYPSGLWEAGERIVHRHRLPIPPRLPEGVYTVRVGLYDPQTGQRLPAVDATGNELADGAIPVGAFPAVGGPVYLPYVVVGPAQEP